MQSHRISLFGQKTAILLDSPNWSDPHIYLRFLKKKADDTWEKPSAKEGKVIKINLLESIAIRDLCNSTGGKWSTVHVFGEEKTSISMEKEGQNLKINIPGYSKFIQYPESTLFAELIAHLVSEKIQNATGAKADNNNDQTSQPQPILSNNSIVNSNPPSTSSPIKNQSPEIQYEKIQMQKRERPPKSNSNSQILAPNTTITPEMKEILDAPVDYPFDDEDIISGPTPSITPEAWLEALKKEEEFCLIPGQVTAQRPKAISFQILGKNQIWIPISTIQKLDQAPSLNGVWVKQWWLEKNLDKVGTA